MFSSRLKFLTFSSRKNIYSEYFLCSIKTKMSTNTYNIAETSVGKGKAFEERVRKDLKALGITAYRIG